MVRCEEEDRGCPTHDMAKCASRLVVWRPFLRTHGTADPQELCITVFCRRCLQKRLHPMPFHWATDKFEPRYGDYRLDFPRNWPQMIGVTPTAYALPPIITSVGGNKSRNYNERVMFGRFDSIQNTCMQGSPWPNSTTPSHACVRVRTRSLPPSRVASSIFMLMIMLMLVDMVVIVVMFRPWTRRRRSITRNKLIQEIRLLR
jgi:hypothetical protein